MGGFFMLEFDTIPPRIEIYAPPYSDRQTQNEITIVSDEKLSNYQDIYIIDGLGAKHVLVFTLQGNSYVGNISFDNYPTGIAKIYAQLKDEVGNISDLASKTIEIISSHESLALKIGLSENENHISVDDEDVGVLLFDSTQILSVSESASIVSVFDARRKVYLFKESAIVIIKDK